MQLLDVEVVMEARRLAAGILAHRDREGSWPFSPVINQMSAYKYARNKAGMVEYAKRSEWLETVEHGSNATNGKPRVEYQATDQARVDLALPDPLPPRAAVPYPEDAAECAIYSFHDGFFQKHGRWPMGAERGSAFTGTHSRVISKYRRQPAYDSLVNDGTMVEIKIRTPWLSREVSCYVIVNKSPEYMGKHGILYYSKSIPT